MVNFGKKSQKLNNNNNNSLNIDRFGRSTTEVAQQIFSADDKEISTNIYWPNLRYFTLDHPFTHPEFNLEKRFSILHNGISYDHPFIVSC